MSVRVNFGHASRNNRLYILEKLFGKTKSKPSKIPVRSRKIIFSNTLNQLEDLKNRLE